MLRFDSGRGESYTHIWEECCDQFDAHIHMIREPFNRIRVECYSGYRGEEEPRWFYWEERRIQVEEILDRWLDPTHRYFKVRASGGIYLLRHDVDAGEWEMRTSLPNSDASA